MLNGRANALRVFHHEMPERFPRNEDFCNMFFPLERSSRPDEGDDGFGVHWVVIPNAGQTIHYLNGPPLTDITLWREQVQWPDLDGYNWTADAARQTAPWDRKTQMGMVVLFNGHFERLHALMGFEDALVAFYDEPEAVHELFSAMTEYKLRCLHIAKEYYNPDIIVFHDDWGTNNNMFFSPDLWREFIAPQLKRVIDETHKLGMIFEMHSCGHIQEVVGDLVEMGVDCLQSLQYPQNDIRMVKENWGDKLVIRGGVDNQFALNPESTDMEIRQSFRACFEIMAQGGNYLPYLAVLGSNAERPLTLFKEEVDCFEQSFFSFS